MNRSSRIDSVAAGLAKARLLSAGENMMLRSATAMRSLSYHDVQSVDRDQFAAQMRWIADRFTPLGLAGLRQFASGQIVGDKPPIVVTFDDGFLSQTQIAMPVLDELQIPGWFFIPTEPLDLAPDKHFQWAASHGMNPASLGYRDGEPVFASWADWQRSSPDHCIGSHSETHLRFGSDVDAHEVAAEVDSSLAAIKERLGRDDRVFSWVGGELSSYTAVAASALRERDLEFAFTANSKRYRPGDDPLQIARTNVEAHFSWDRFRMALSGFVDVRYWLKRKRVADIFKSEREGRDDTPEGCRTIHP